MRVYDESVSNSGRFLFGRIVISLLRINKQFLMLSGNI